MATTDPTLVEARARLILAQHGLIQAKQCLDEAFREYNAALALLRSPNGIRVDSSDGIDVKGNSFGESQERWWATA